MVYASNVNVSLQYNLNDYDDGVMMICITLLFKKVM